MPLTREEIAAELSAIAEFDAALDKRIERLLRQSPLEIRQRIAATSLGAESGVAKDAAMLAELISEEAEAA